MMGKNMGDMMSKMVKKEMKAGKPQKQIWKYESNNSKNKPGAVYII
jgi:hypothetical protein